jgi:hypothetical protein
MGELARQKTGAITIVLDLVGISTLFEAGISMKRILIGLGRCGVNHLRLLKSVFEAAYLNLSTIYSQSAG